MSDDRKIHNSFDEVVFREHACCQVAGQLSHRPRVLRRNFVDRLLLAGLAAQYAPDPIPGRIGEGMPHRTEGVQDLCHTLVKLSGARKMAI